MPRLNIDPEALEVIEQIENCLKYHRKLARQLRFLRTTAEWWTHSIGISGYCLTPEETQARNDEIACIDDALLKLKYGDAEPAIQLLQSF